MRSFLIELLIWTANVYENMKHVYRAFLEEDLLVLLTKCASVKFHLSQGIGGQRACVHKAELANNHLEDYKEDDHFPETTPDVSVAL